MDVYLTLGIQGLTDFVKILIACDTDVGILDDFTISLGYSVVKVFGALGDCYTRRFLVWKRLWVLEVLVFR